MQQDRAITIIAGLIFMAFAFGGFMKWFNDHCPSMSQGSCQFLIVAAIVSVIGGIGLTEFFVARRKAQGKWQAQNVHSSEPVMTSKLHWIRAIGWVTLSSIAAGLPIFGQGTLLIALLGPATGFMLSVLVRAITNRLPPSGIGQ